MLYLNDSDGYTVIFDENKDIKKKISPKKNRVVIFDGMSYHAGSHPCKSNTRMLLNINFNYK